MQFTALIWATVVVGQANAAFVEYTDRASLYGQLGTVVLDDYEYPGTYNDVGMTAVINETTYTNLTFGSFASFLVNESNFRADTNAWCNGCNGSTLLGFTSTSVGDAFGVFNVGFEIVSGLGEAIVTFGDGSSQTFMLPPPLPGTGIFDTAYAFWGINSR